MTDVVDPDFQLVTFDGTIPADSSRFLPTLEPAATLGTPTVFDTAGFRSWTAWISNRATTIGDPQALLTFMWWPDTAAVGDGIIAPARNEMLTPYDATITPAQPQTHMLTGRCLGPKLAIVATNFEPAATIDLHIIVTLHNRPTRFEGPYTPNMQGVTLAHIPFASRATGTVAVALPYYVGPAMLASYTLGNENMLLAIGTPGIPTDPHFFERRPPTTITAPVRDAAGNFPDIWLPTLTEPISLFISNGNAAAQVSEALLIAT